MSKYVHSGDYFGTDGTGQPVSGLEQGAAAGAADAGANPNAGDTAGADDAGVELSGLDAGGPADVALELSTVDALGPAVPGAEQGAAAAADTADPGAQLSAEDISGAVVNGAKQSAVDASSAGDAAAGQNGEDGANKASASAEQSAMDAGVPVDAAAQQSGEAGTDAADLISGQAAGPGEMEAARELGAPDDGSEDKPSGFLNFLFSSDDSESPKKSAEADPETEPVQGKENDIGLSNDPKQNKRDKELSNSVEGSIEYWHGEDRVPDSLEQTKEVLTEVMGLGASFDIVFREMTFGGTKAALLFISGFAKDVILDEILKRLTYLTPDDLSSDAFAAFMQKYIPHIQVEKSEKLSDAMIKTMAGMSALFVEGEAQVIIMDTRAYPVRGPEEPSIERVVRGARDGFTETLLSNIALVRRRLRDPGLKFELHQVGRRTKTDVAIAYIDDIADKTQVKAVTEKIKTVNIDGIPLADKQLEEAIIGEKWNPYPMVRYSERPDIVASHLLEGRVVVFVDTSPSVMVIPTTFFDLCQHAEENRQTPLMGSYLRWVRFAGIFASIFLLPLWMLFVLQPELKPAPLEFIGPHEMAKIPLLVQFLIIEFGVDLLRMAAVHTPSPLGSAMGLIAAILIGDIAVKTGLFVNEVVLYMAVATIGMFATPSYELGLANRLVRLLLLVATGLFHVAGFVIGSTLFVLLLTINRSYNSSYLWPFIPFNAKAMGAILYRQSVVSSSTRPSFNKTRDNTRMSENEGKKGKP